MGVLDQFSLKGRIALVTAGSGTAFWQQPFRRSGRGRSHGYRGLPFPGKKPGLRPGTVERGYDAHGMQLDISDTDSVHRLHDRILQKFGRLDILVNSALARVGGSFESQTSEDWLASARGDMVGLFTICKNFVPDMVRQKKGSIINISSIYGVVANDPTLYEGTTMKQAPTYNFVKAGMINFTRHIANYYGKQGVRANCISPGGYLENQPQPFLDNYCKRVPIGRMLDNEDIKGAVVFLASDASAYVTGINLMLDGGWTTL